MSFVPGGEGMASLGCALDRKLARSELAVLVSQYGKAQIRCSSVIAEQAALIDALQAEQVCLRAELVIRVTALQFEREDRMRLEAMAPGLPRRAVLARQIEYLMGRIEALLREQTRWRWGREPRREARPSSSPKVESPTCDGGGGMVEGGAFAPQEEASTGPAEQEAELLICRTGCISHGDYWRVQDQCRRTGKPCILIDEHQAIHAMRQGDGIVIQACPVRSL